ncbi:MAG: hypothetical protein ACI8QC_003668 [Planctomycetota bacterium]|jgi:hypothetical protein
MDWWYSSATEEARFAFPTHSTYAWRQLMMFNMNARFCASVRA